MESKLSSSPSSSSCTEASGQRQRLLAKMRVQDSGRQSRHGEDSGERSKSNKKSRDRARGKSRRAVKACSTCRARKVRCDVVERTPCGNCHWAGVEVSKFPSMLPRIQNSIELCFCSVQLKDVDRGESTYSYNLSIVELPVTCNATPTEAESC